MFNRFEDLKGGASKKLLYSEEAKVKEVRDKRSRRNSVI